MEEVIERAIYQECLCSNDNASTLICVQQDCLESSFMCSIQTCICHQKHHIKCKIDRTNDLLEKIQNKNLIAILEMNNDMTSSFDEAVYVSVDMECQLSQFKEQIELFGLEKNTIQIISLINFISQKGVDAVDGDLVANSLTEIRKEEPILSIDQIVLERILREMINKLQKTFDSFLKYQELLQQTTRENFLRSFISSEWEMKSNKLQDIQELILSSCYLEEIPSQLKLFPKLKRLDLSKNKIKQIKNLDSLTQLQVLLLDQNQIANIANLEKLTKLNALNLGGNPLTQNELEKQKIQQMRANGIVLCDKL